MSSTTRILMGLVGPLVLVGCLAGPTEGYSGAVDAEPGSLQSEDNVDAEPGNEAETEGSDDSDDSDDSDESDESEEESLGSKRFEGEMEATYTYDGSLGSFAEDCDGSAFIVIEDDRIDGEGVCQNEVITFGFMIEGTVDDEVIEGLLISDNAAGRAETPFTGEIDGPDSRLTFDYTHAADGESLRLEGSMTLAQNE